MRRVVVLCGIFGLVSAATGVVLSSLLESQPQIDQLEVAGLRQEHAITLTSEIGYPDASIECDCRLSNPFDHSVVVSFLGASCGCTTVRASEKKLKARDTLTLPARSITTLVLRSTLPRQAGKHEFLASFHAAGSDEFNVSCIVPVVADVVVDPEVLIQELRAPSTQNVERRVQLIRTYRRVSPGKCHLEADQLPPYVELVRTDQVTAARQVAPGIWEQSWQCTLRIKPEEVVGAHPEPSHIRFLFVEQANERSSEAVLPLIVRRLYGIESPRSINLGPVPVGQRTHKRMLIRAADDRPFKVVEWHSSAAEVSIKVEGSSPAKRHWIDVECLGMRAGEIQADLAMITTHPDCPKVNIALFGRVIDGLREPRNSSFQSRSDDR